MPRILLAIAIACSLGLAGLSASAGAKPPSERRGAAPDRGAAARCDAIIAGSMGALHRIAHGIDLTGNCNRVANALTRLADAGCADHFEAGLLAVNAQAHRSPVRALICEAVVDGCSFELPPGACES